MKPTRKKPAKKRNPIISKLLDLKYRINDTAKAEGGWSGDMNTNKQWVQTLIDGIRSGNDITKERMLMANEMWNKYSSSRMNNWESSNVK